ncbi:MAG TPA: protein kinase [Bryobacteraceae bacterium]|nr:protein kinase [Bryobacteraceae bacterium]
MPLSVGDKLGPYEILAPLGAGGMGEVWKARDTKLDREVAIKVLPAALAHDLERLARFEREAKVLASLNHPNIAQIYGIEESSGVRALVMELVPGQTLVFHIKPGPLPLETALNYAKQIADALEAAHEKTITHRDLKPANIMITPAGVVKVLDFGLAAVGQASTPGDGNPTNSPTLTMRATQAGMIMGTAGYMSPEQAAGQTVDRRADIWAFGVVLWEMLTGQRLFTGDTIAHILADVLRAPIDFDKLPKGTPPAIRELLRRCLDRDVKNRLQWIGEGRVAIQKYLADPAGRTKVSQQNEASRTKFLWPAVTVVAVLTAATLSFVHFREQPPPAAEPVRFQIPLPDKGTPVPFPTPAVSPDGRRVVFQAVTEGVARLWVRALDQLEPRPLAGTEGVVGLQFWSPDSRFVAFDVQGTLKKVEASGGPAQSLCTLPGNLLGGFWTGDGRIVFGTLASGLFQVAAAGGAASPITVLDPKRQETYHAFPALLPDGLHFLYTRFTVNAETSGIFLGTLAAGTVNPGPEQQASKRLLADVSSSVFARPPDPRATGDGYVLFSREGTLMAQPFDGARLEFSRDATPIAEQVPGTGAFSVSSTGVLVFATRAGAGAGRRLTWYDRQGKSLGTSGAGASDASTELELAPDGTRVAVVRLGSTWIDEFARGVTNRIRPPDTSVRPVWSPDGNRIVFASPPNVYVKAASNAGKEEVLFKFERATDPLDWSRDGRWLLYQETDPITKHDLWALPMEEGKPAGKPPAGKPIVFLQTASDEREGKFSPDGRFVAYVSDESGKSEVYVASFPAPSFRVPISNGGGYQPRWRRDGKELLYLTGDSKLMSVDVTLGGTFQAGVPKALFVVPIIGGGTGQLHRWDLTADGQRFIVDTVRSGDASAPLTLVENWTALLRK